MKFFSEAMLPSTQKKLQEGFEKMQENLDIEKEFSRSVEITTKTGDYEKIVNKLKDEKLWEDQLLNTKKQFDSQIDMTDFPAQEDFTW